MCCFELKDRLDHRSLHVYFGTYLLEAIGWNLMGKLIMYVLKSTEIPSAYLYLKILAIVASFILPYKYVTINYHTSSFIQLH